MKIFITRPISKVGIEMLKKKHSVTVQRDRRNLPKNEMIARVKGKGFDAILCLLTNTMDADVMDAAGPQLKVLSNYAVGFDNIDVEAAKKRNIIVTNTPSEEVSVSVAEHTFTLMLALSRRIVEADRFARAGKYMGWDPDLLIGRDVYDKTIGLLGMGRIGKEVVRRARLGFGAAVLYYDLHRDLAFEKEYGVKYVSQEKLFALSDILSVHVPLLPSTRHVVSTKFLRLMKRSALIINTARGPIVDEKALLKALYGKKLGGYALDVFECEPEIDCDPSDQYELKKLDTVIMTPHIASATVNARNAMARIAAQNILDVFSGKKSEHTAR